MEFLTALMLGALQGLTEFLPISSSGHLALAEALLPEEALSTPGILFEVVVHLGTLAAALLWLRQEVGTLGRSLGPSGSVEGRKLLLRIAVASVPAVLVGLAVAGIIRTHFADPGFAGFGLLLTGALLLVAGKRGEEETDAAELPAAPGGIPRCLADRDGAGGRALSRCLAVGGPPSWPESSSGSPPGMPPASAFCSRRR